MMHAKRPRKPMPPTQISYANILQFLLVETLTPEKTRD